MKEEESKSELPEFEFPESPGNYAYHSEVIAYSYYLRILGYPQKLKYGDYYYKRDTSDDFKISLYLTDSKSMSDENLELLGASFFRMVSIEEAIVMINRYGYSFTMANGIAINDDLSTVMNLVNNTVGISYRVTATNPHACYLKAAYLAAIQTKSLTDANKVIEKEGIFRMYPSKE